MLIASTYSSTEAFSTAYLNQAYHCSVTCFLAKSRLRIVCRGQLLSRPQLSGTRWLRWAYPCQTKEEEQGYSMV